MKNLVFIFCFLSLHVHAHTIPVKKNGTYTTITGAIAAAVNGDTIVVEKNIYREQNIIINKPLTLIGQDHPVLDGENKFEIISIKADNVTIDGFTLQNTGVSSLNDFAAIKIYNRKKASIVNNIISNAFFGIYAQYAVNCLIQNNRLTAQGKDEQESGNGIHCWKSDSMRIIANAVSGHRDGIYFEFVTNSVIWRNNSFNNLRYGLHFMFSNNDAYISNQFEHNGSGVAVMFSTGVKMYNNYFTKNWGDAAYGILLKEINDSYIEGNHFERNTMGIYAEGVNRLQVQKNVFKNNGWALKVQASCSDINFFHNNFLANSFDVATNGELVLNTFDHNYWDKYEGYDLNKDNNGDIPYRPVSMYAMIIEKNPPAIILFRSFMTSLLDKTEKVLPTLTPTDLKDNYPLMKKLLL